MKEYREKIIFKHEIDEEFHTFRFVTEPNPYNDHQMWWFEPQRTMYSGTIEEAKLIAKNIKKGITNEKKRQDQDGMEV